MGVNTNIAVMYAQNGLGTQFAHTAAVGPHAQAAMSRMVAVEHAKHEQHQVAKTSEAENRGVDKDGHKKKDPEEHKQKKAKKDDHLNEENVELLYLTPEEGNFLNVTV